MYAIRSYYDRRRLEEQAPRTWQRMLSGRRLNLITPSPLDIEIHDIVITSYSIHYTKLYESVGTITTGTLA